MYYFQAKMKCRIKEKILSIIILFSLIIYYSINEYLLKRLKARQQANKPKIRLSDFYSYSQYQEDLILYILLYDIENGFYIDVGAFDPIKVSVTKAFSLRGWTGINIEPQPDKKDLFDKDRPKDINLQLAIGEKKGNVEFYINDQCSTYIKQYSRNAKTMINVSMDTMSNICKKYVPKGRNVDFCKIDVEGGEKNVLLGYDFINYRPKVFCIESTVPLSYIPTYESWENILIQNNYMFVYKRSVNRFYVDKNYPELIERSKNISEYLSKIRMHIIN